MMDSETKHIHIADYNYPLPSERIAKYPLKERDQSKLLLYRQGEVGEDVFANLSAYLPKGSLLVFNNTRVIQARIHFRKETGALIEVFLMEPAQPTDYERIFQTTGHCAWLCMVGNLKKWKEGALTKVCTVKGKDVTKESINAAMKAATSESFGYNEDQIVSSDVIGMRYGSLFDATQTMVAKIDDDTYQVQVVSWYDNVNSYTSQMVRTIKYFAENC